MASNERGSAFDGRPEKSWLRIGIASTLLAITVGVVASTADTPTLRCTRPGECVLEEAYLWIPVGERRFAIEDISRVTHSGPWERVAVYVELADGTRLAVQHDSAGHGWDAGYHTLLSFLENEHDGQIELRSSTFEAAWLFCIPLVVIAIVLLEV